MQNSQMEAREDCRCGTTLLKLFTLERLTLSGIRAPAWRVGTLVLSKSRTAKSRASPGLRRCLKHTVPGGFGGRPARRNGSGGAGGIRTHEWRFCRPLPWATWVPRQTLKYSKSLKHARSYIQPLRRKSLFFLGNCRNFRLAQEPRRFFRRRRIDVKTRSPFKSRHLR
jgi:hypothetical protein